MTLLTYQVFQTIADVGSFQKAADLLGLTPSAVSHTISSMENELGFSVFNRSKAGISLTNYGEKLLPYINGVLNSDESLQQVIADLNGLNREKSRSACFPVYVPAGFRKSFILFRRSMKKLMWKYFREPMRMFFCG